MRRNSARAAIPLPDTAKPLQHPVAEVRRFPQNRRADAAASTGMQRIALAAGGDADAWNGLVRRYLPAVVRCAAYMLGDGAEAEDVAQDTFVRLHRKLPQWEGGEEGLAAWLHRVAVNLCIDRHRAPRSAYLEDIGEVAEPAALDGPLDRKRHVAAALADLPERQRAALVLVHYQGLSGREAAAALDISVEAVESLLARARRSLRRTLAPARAELLGTSRD